MKMKTGEIGYLGSLVSRLLLQDENPQYETYTTHENSQNGETQNPGEEATRIRVTLALAMRKLSWSDQPVPFISDYLPFQHHQEGSLRDNAQK